MFSTFPLISKYLDGVCASSVNEARLRREEFGREVEVFAPAYSDKDIRELQKYADIIIFNSIRQLKKYKKKLKGKLEIGLRLNPEYSEIKVDLYNPCAEYS
ncbi:MAG: carboxynorspermidine decarboxylase, partial [Proteobacteria bacterium]|nr:carboxynorspermidine decarboxylase [Pseudomonadota bacterium]